ncbi:amidohydrolase family protein, partial [Frankia canadensis]|uniref:amidohydrolase family protein n=1 Tax=Frankia canadensis TaxID=1836972 RepID=UPI001054918A
LSRSITPTDSHKKRCIQAEPGGARVIDAAGSALLPGFVDAHVHSLDILLRGGVADDRPLYDWLVNVNLPAARAYRLEDHATAVRLFSLEALRSGITTVVDQIEVPFAEWDEISDVVVDTYVQTGLRAVVGQMFYDTVPPEMDALMAAYTRKEPQLTPDLGAQPGGLEDVLAKLETLIRRHHGKADGRISYWPAPGVAILCTADALLGAQRLARRHGVMTTVHVAESPLDRMQQGMSSVQYLAAIGYLAPDVLAGHCVQVDTNDIRALAVAGAKVSSQPVSNLFLGNGIAPVADMQTAGVVVALGTDDGNCNNSVNFLADMKFAALLQKGRAGNPAVLGAEKVLEMATIDGATAVGLADVIGSVEVGKQADLILVDLSGAHLHPRQSTASVLVYQANGTEVHTVVIAGEVVLENRQPTWLDPDAERRLVEDVDEASARILTDARVRPRTDQTWVSRRAV